MQKIVLLCLVVFGIATASFGQEIKPCGTTAKMQDFYESLSPKEQLKYNQQQAAYEQETQDYIALHPGIKEGVHNKTIKYTIPIVFHIIHEGGAENITNEQVKDAVKQLNLDFQKLTTDWGDVVSDFLPLVADIQVEFKLAKLDPNGNCTNGITRTYSNTTETGVGMDQVNAIKAAHGVWRGDEYLNIFVSENIGGAAGYTMLPNNWKGGKMSNGIHILSVYVGSIGTSNVNKEHTLSHEVGHWLNLWHPWGGTNSPNEPENCNYDDKVKDTPICKGFTSCSLTHNSCNDAGDSRSSWTYDVVDNIENFMAYAYCSKMFTTGQKARMWAALNSSVGNRNQIWSSSNLVKTGVNLPDVLCQAKFSSDLKTVCLGGSVQFSDMSYNNVTSWDWKFEGGVPSTSTQEDPIVQYNTPGLYKVKLTVSDGTTTESVTKTAYIRVLNTGEALPFQEGFEGATPLDGDFWSVENPGNNAAFTVTPNAAYSGTHAIKLQNFGQASGNIDAFISQPIDLSSVTDKGDVSLTFKYAYRKQSSTDNSILKVSFSTDCGQTWMLRIYKAAPTLSTDIESNSWIPSSTADWGEVTFTNFTSQFWVKDLRIKFEFETDGGNNLYIDDINIGPPSANGIEAIVGNIHHLSIYPNPTKGLTNISFTTASPQEVKIQLVNMMGQVMQTKELQTKEGSNKVRLETSNIESGVYLIKIRNEKTQAIRRLIVQ